MIDQLVEQASTGTRSFRGKEAAWWCLTFLGFPVGGLVAEAIVGPIDAVWVAVVAGAIAGSAIGAAQWLVLRRIGIDARWIAQTGAGLAVGLGVGVAILDYGTSIGDLAVLGAVSGLFVGGAQWLVLREHVGASVLWILGVAALWALGWAITTSIGVDVESKWAVFGASGAITVTLFVGRSPVAALAARFALGERTMNVEVVGGVLLIVAPVWFNTTFALLGRQFEYPDILRRPADEILDRFRAGGPVAHPPVVGVHALRAAVDRRCGAARAIASVSRVSSRWR